MKRQTMTRKFVYTLALCAAMPGLVLAQGMSMGGSPAGKANMEAMQKMQSDMPKPSGEPDNDFVAMMIPHHQGAIDMAKVELQYGKDPMLKAMAKMIVSAQEKEIKKMRDWQNKHK
jgi:uncharacterized protein (DUF305 family)